MIENVKRYTDYNTYLRSFYNERIQKITVDAGLSCPNRDGTLSRKGCIYCNAKGSGSGLFNKGLSIKEQIDQGKIAMTKKYKAKKFLAYFQSFSNTYAPVTTLNEIYAEALSCEGVVGMAIGTRPDCVDDDKLDLMASFAKNYLVWLEYGLQSIHDSTLALINRRHDFDCFKKAVEKTRNRYINVCTHVILGLPAEDKSMMLDTAKTLSGMGINGVKIHLLYVIKGTALDKMYLDGDYECLSQDEYVDIVCDFIERLPKDIIIQRITGDPHSDELRAPLWAGRYRETFNMIQKILEQRDTYQGKKAED
ncbi:MAG: TIGR01212 family radical SAM protein [Desulfobacteraceae bacterium]|nr:TIGR01212 family radical SAM protein [Desulfobacteraceae bacterium]